MSKEDAVCNRLAELALNDLSFAGQLLQEAVVGCQYADSQMQDRDVCRAFQASLRQSLQVIVFYSCLTQSAFQLYQLNFLKFNHRPGRCSIQVLRYTL